MIKYVNDLHEIIPLWQEAFGDSEEDILYFINTCKNKSCVAVYDNGKPLSMLFLVDCQIMDEKSKYIYAASTFKENMKKGFMSELLDFCKKEYKNICLIPANDSLVHFYNKREFINKLKIDDIIFNECEEIKEYLFEGCSLIKPFALQYKGD